MAEAITRCYQPPNQIGRQGSGPSRNMPDLILPDVNLQLTYYLPAQDDRVLRGQRLSVGKTY
jgi:hypothetical protein